MLQGVSSPKIVRHEINQIDKLFSSPIVASRASQVFRIECKFQLTHLTDQ